MLTSRTIFCLDGPVGLSIPLILFSHYVHTNKEVIRIIRKLENVFSRQFSRLWLGLKTSLVPPELFNAGNFHSRVQVFLARPN